MKSASAFAFLTLIFLISLLYVQFLNGFLGGEWKNFDKAQALFGEYGLWVLVISGLVVTLVCVIQYIKGE